MTPTHRHADGGLYEYIGPQSGKSPLDGVWYDGVAYRDGEGQLHWTTTERWNDRFTSLQVAHNFISLEADEEVFATFSFTVYEAGDVRHMLMRAAPQPGTNINPIQRDWLKRVLMCQAEAVTKGLHLRDHDYPDFIGDVNAFHAKFGQEYTGKPRMLPQDLHEFRTQFHEEETDEYKEEYADLVDAVARKDRRDIINSLELQLDALVDSVWVLLGTADLQFGRHAFNEAWRRVFKANMAKVLAKEDPNAEDSGREVKYDIRKPAGWMAPDHRDLVSDNAIFDEIFGQQDEAMSAEDFNAAAERHG